MFSTTGEIIGTGDQRNGTVFADSTAQDFSFFNRGLVDAGEGNEGAGFVAELSEAGNDFSITNVEAIRGRGDAAAGTAAAGDGVRLERTRVDGALDGSTTGLFTGEITNDGIFEAADGTNGTVAGFRTVDGVDFQGTLDNTGFITGSQNGVYFGEGDHTGGVVTNSGLITSDSRAVNIDGEGLAFENSGLIEATDRQRNGTVYVDGTADNFEVSNIGTIDAASGGGSGVSVEVGSETGDIQSGSIINGGTIIGAGELAEDAGVRLSAGALGETTFAGDIVNTGTITSEEVAVLVEEGVLFDGDVINNGIIDGEIDLSSGGIVLNDGSVIYLDVAGVNDVEQISTEDEVTFGGDLNVRFTEGFVPEFGQTFDLIDFGASSGNFTSVAAEGFDFDTSNLAIDGTVTVRNPDGSVEVVDIDDVDDGEVILGDGSVAEELGAVVVAEGEQADIVIPEGAAITSAETAIEVNGEATINNNAGVIAGAGIGVDFADTGSGTLNNNAGVISSDNRAIQISGEDIVIVNDGDIIGTGDQTNGTVLASSPDSIVDILGNTTSSGPQFEFTNNGLIDAGEGNDGSGFSVELAAREFSGRVSSSFIPSGGSEFELQNNGVIQGRGDAADGLATAGDGIRLEVPRDNDGFDTPLTFNGSITNDGLIDSEGDNGDVAGFRVADEAQFAGELINNGTISGTRNGVVLGDDFQNGAFVENNGLISSDSRALSFGSAISVDSGEIVNNGAILGTDDQRNGTVFVEDFLNNFENNGLVDAGEGNDGAGVSILFGGDSLAGSLRTLDNNGLIQGRGNADAADGTAGDGIRIEGTRVDGVLDGTTGEFIHNVDNSGLIDSEGDNGTVAGFRVVDGIDFTGQLNNDGTISGTRNGVYFGDGDHGSFRGAVNNTGTISSDSRAFNIDGTGLVLNNDGIIEATDRQRNGTVYVDGTADEFNINNVGTIDASGGAGSGISIQVGAEDGDVQSGNIDNAGFVIGSGELEQDAGVRLAAGAEGGTTFAGDIVNSGTITSEEVAVLIEDGVLFDGDLINNGTIDGEIDLSSGGIVLNDGSIIYLDIAGVNDVEQISTEDEVTFGGDLNVRFTEGFVPEFGQTFDLIDFGASSGNFTSVAAEGFDFDTSNLAIDGTVTVIAQDGSIEVVDIDDVDDDDTVIGDGSVAEELGVVIAQGEETSVINAAGESINSVGTAVEVNGLVFLDNAGGIAGGVTGVDLNETGTGTVINTGLIASDSRAVEFSADDFQFGNDGAILGTDDQRNGTVFVDPDAQNSTFTNDGLVEAGEGNLGSGISVEVTQTATDFEIRNSGSILGRGDAAAGTAEAGDGIRLEPTRVDGALDGSTTGVFEGFVFNTGLISAEEATNGSVAGFRVADGVDFNGNFTNGDGGLITGSQNGVYFGEGNHDDSVISNVGGITSDSRAVSLDGDNLAFFNFGFIEATDRQRNGTVFVDGTADNFIVSNQNILDARGGAGSGISVEVGSETGDVQNGSLINGAFGGLIVGSGELAEDAGIRLSAGADGGTTFSGDITNRGTIASEQAAAILIEDGVQFDGQLFNQGVIDGAIDFSSGDVFLTSLSEVNLDIAGVNDVEQISTSGEVTFNGDLNVSFTEGFVPEAGQSFDLIDFGTTTGSFESVAAEGFEFDTSNLSIDGTVTVVGQDGVVEVVAAADIAEGDVVLGDASVAEEIAAAEETVAFQQLAAVEETAVVAAAATAQDVTVLDDLATVEKVAVAQTQTVATKEAVATQEVAVKKTVVKDVVASAAETVEAPAELSRDEIRQQERAARDQERAARDQERAARDQERETRRSTRTATRSARSATRASFARLRK